MDFFLKLGKKATETYQITKEKATNLTEELKMKSKINDSKEKIENLYREIGKKVFEEIKAGKDVVREEISEKIEEISKLYDQIEKTEMQILALKKIKKCTNCNTELELNAEFCSKCGFKQEKTDENIEIKENSNEDAKEAEVIEINNVENKEGSIE